MNPLGDTAKQELHRQIAEELNKSLTRIAVMQSVDIPSKAMREALIQSAKKLSDVLVTSLKLDTTKQ